MKAEVKTHLGCPALWTDTYNDEPIAVGRVECFKDGFLNEQLREIAWRVNLFDERDQALRMAHDAIDALMAHAIGIDPNFMPSKHKAMRAVEAINAALADSIQEARP